MGVLEESRGALRVPRVVLQGVEVPWGAPKGPWGGSWGALKGPWGVLGCPEGA